MPTLRRSFCLIEYQERVFFVSNWSSDRSLRHFDKYYLNQNTRIKAVSVFKRAGLWNAILYFPNGKSFDVLSSFDKKKLFGNVSESTINS